MSIAQLGTYWYSIHFTDARFQDNNSDLVSGILNSQEYLISVKNDVIMRYCTIISVILFIQKISNRYSQEDPCPETLHECSVSTDSSTDILKFCYNQIQVGCTLKLSQHHICSS